MGSRPEASPVSPFGPLMLALVVLVTQNQLVRFRNSALLYCCLFGTIALTVVLPPESILIEPIHGDTY